MANLSNINNVLRVSSDLRVGINTDAASYALEIGGTNSGIKLKNSGGSGKVYSLLSDTAGNFQIYDDAAASGRLVISSGGDATFSGSITVGAGNSSIAGDLYFGVNADIFKSSGTLMITASDSTFAGELNVKNASSRFISLNYEDSINSIISHNGSSYGLENLNVRGDNIYFYTDYEASSPKGNITLTLQNNHNAKFEGNVGIGLGPSTYSLHIYKSNPIALIQAANTSGAAQVQFFPRDASNVAHLQSIKGVNSDLTFLTGGNSGNSYVPTKRLTIDSSGIVGIGVDPDLGNGGLMVTRVANGIFANANQLRVASFYDGSVNTNRPGVVLGYDNSSTPHGIIAARTQTGSGTIPGLQFFTYNGGWGPRMTILSNGNVGIGTTSPPVKLSINGWSYNPGAAANAGMVGLKQSNASSYGYVVEASANDKWMMMGHNGTNGVIETTYAASAGHSNLEIKTGSSNNIILQSTGGKVGIGGTTVNTKLDVRGTTGTRNHNTTTNQTSSIYEISRYFTATANTTTNISIDTTVVFPPMSTAGYILVEVSASGYASGGANGMVFSWISGGYGGHAGPLSYHPLVVIANNIDNGSVAAYYPNSTTMGIAVTNGSGNALGGVMRVKVTTTY